MAYNCKIELNGNLGKDAKTITKNDKTFIALSIATKDSYPHKDGDNITWKDSKITLWHDVLIFNTNVIEVAKNLKKGDRVEIFGTLSYRFFQDENKNTKKEATVIGHFINKIDFENLSEPNEEDIINASEAIGG